MTLVYKICQNQEWEEANQTGFYLGSKVDIEDGFIHLSTIDQLKVTVSKHFALQKNLILIEFETDKFENEIKWEKSRGGDLFPHFYGKMDVQLAKSTYNLELGSDGFHKFPKNLFS